VVGEDNEAARQIGHAGKVTGKIQTAALQKDIASMKLALRRVGSKQASLVTGVTTHGNESSTVHLSSDYPTNLELFESNNVLSQ
jgi:hypothetical protein